MRLEEKEAYERRFQAFSRKLSRVRKMQPQKDYLYRVMEQVAFQDMDVALDIAISAYEEKAAQPEPVTPV